jgi:hypothetical protein
MLGAHSSHSYQTGTNLYFVYDYTIRCSPREEIEVYHKPLNAIIVTEPCGRADRSCTTTGSANTARRGCVRSTAAPTTCCRPSSSAFDP